MVNTIIAKTNGKDKVIDFRDCLNLANKDDYAMMHGIGGKEHARTSVIKLTICDYTAGKGELSKTVSANISPATCEKLFEVCKRNIGTLVVNDNVAPLVEQRSHNKKQNKIADMQFEVLQHVLKLTKAIYKAANQKQMPGVEVIANSLISMLSQAKDHVLAQEEDPPRPAAFEIPCHCDINYVQDRVHASKAGADGYAPVQRLTIAHHTYRQDGKQSMYPWMVKVVNGNAFVKVSDIGATTFDPKTLRDTTEAFIMISDDDMFRCMNSVLHYIDAWEKLACIPLIKEGLKKRQAEYEAYKQSQQEGV